MASDHENATLLLVDDHPLMRKGLRALLEGEPDLEVAGEAGDGEEAIARAKALSPDIVVMDVSMPRLNGIEATRRLLEEAPRTRVLARSIHSEKRFVDEMLRAGAAGYLLKDGAPEELVRAVRALLRGESYVSAPLIGTLISSLRQTPSEQTPAPSPGRSPDGARAPDPPRAGTGEARTQAPAISAPQVSRTKLYPPTFPPDMVPRTDLLERLEARKTRPLTLVSAPAGYGKSLLVGSWLASCGWASAWLALDEGDGDLRQFVSGLVAAVQTRFPPACASSCTLTEAHELPSVETLSTTSLSNNLDALPEPLILVGLHGGVQQTEEYLVQEVIGRQPPRLRDWLLRSAILDRFLPIPV